MKGLRILEIACGKGAVAYLLKYDCGAEEYVGIDLCLNFIFTAGQEFKNEQGVNFLVANACDLPKHFDGHFDMVIWHTAWPEQSQNNIPVNECHYIVSHRN